MRLRCSVVPFRELRLLFCSGDSLGRIALPLVLVRLFSCIGAKTLHSASRLGSAFESVDPFVVALDPVLVQFSDMDQLIQA